MTERTADSEKITINLGHVDLGHIDLMVQEGFYSNRTDFIRTAIRNQIERHADTAKQAIVRKRVELALRHFSREDLEEVRATGRMLQIRVSGLASIAGDVTPELACATIESIAVLGALHATSAVKPLWRTVFDNWAASVLEQPSAEPRHRKFVMNDRLRAGMRQAGRLTRASRLIEATALLQRVLQNGTASRDRCP